MARKAKAPDYNPIITLDEIFDPPDDSFGLDWFDDIIRILDPDEQSVYPEYKNNPVGFAEDILKVSLTDDQKALLMAVLKHEVVIVLSATGVGKTFALAVLAVWLYKTNVDIEVYTAAAPPEKNLKRLLWGELSRLISKRPELFDEDNPRNLMISRAPKQHIEGVSIPQSGKPEIIEAKFSGKHQRVLVFIFDEADAIPDPVYKGADGCMSGGEMVRQIMCLNPRQRDGIPYRRVKDNRAHVIVMSAFNHPNVISGNKSLVPGAVTRDATVRRINEWSDPLRPNEPVEDDCYQVPDFLVGEVVLSDGGIPYDPVPPGWRRITDPQFFYKVLGRYPTTGTNNLFSEVAINRAIERYKAYMILNQGKLPDVRPVMGQDVSDVGVDLNVTLLRYGGLVDIRARWNGVDPGITAERAAKTYKENNVSIAFVDSTGVGAAVPGTMGRLGCENAVPVRLGDPSDGFTEEGEFKFVRDEAFWSCRIWLEKDPTAMLPDDKRLIDAMMIITYFVTQRGELIIMSKDELISKLGYSPDELDALMLTFAPMNNWFGSI